MTDVPCRGRVTLPANAGHHGRGLWTLCSPATRTRVTKRAAPRILAIIALTTASCGSPPQPSDPAKLKNTRTIVAQGKSSVLRAGPRLVPPLSGGSVVVSDVGSDGSRYLVSHGLRVVERPDGSLALAPDFFPAARGVNAVALPERFGGGFVFYTQSSGSTLLWKAASWTAPLTPLAQVDGEVSRLVPGLDRLYLQRERRSPWVALDAENGKPLDLAGLPPAPAYGAMAFGDEWFGAVEVPYRGLVATFDAGASFRSVGLSAQSLTTDNGQLKLQTSSGTFSFGPDGILRPLDAPQAGGEGQQRAGAEVRAQLPSGALGGRPLELAVLRGVPWGKDAALVAAGGALARVRLSDGAVLELRERAYPGTASCQGLPVRTGAGFVCAEPRGKTVLYAVTDPFGLDELMVFDGPRVVASNGNGALAIRGSCDASGGAAGTYCVVPRSGTPYELAVEGDLGVERVVALDDGRALVLIPPRLGAPGSLALIDGAGTRERRVALKLPKTADAVLMTLLKHGLWLNGFEQAGRDRIQGFIAGDGPLVGVRVSFDGKVELGKIEHGGIDRALISGKHALVLGRNGTMVETSDSGFEWRSVDLPAEPQLGRQRTTTGPTVNGCSRVGCAFAGWLRVGYGRSEEDGKLPVAVVPQPVRLPPTGGGRWTLSCEPSGEASPASVVELRTRSAAPSDELATAGWQPFWEEPAPRLARGQLGFDLGTESELNQMHAYVWGPAGADWGKVGQWLVRVADRHRVQGGLWATAPTRSPWATAELAADAFGQTQSGNITVFRLLLDASGRAGLLSLQSRGRNELYVVEEGRAITPLRTTGSIGAVTSVVKLDSGYYVGAASDSRSFRVYRVQGGRLELFSEYPDVVAQSAPPQLVTSTRRNALGLWTRSASWYVHPVNLETGSIESPLELSPALLSRLPRACAEDEDGWLLDGPLGVEPYVDFPRHKDSLSTRHFEARLVAGDGELCAESLAAQSDEPVGPAATPGKSSAPERAPVPLVLSDRHELGRRWAFSCR